MGITIEIDGDALLDAIDGHNLRRAELAERRLEELQREHYRMRYVASPFVPVEQVNEVRADLETMTDYATKLRQERDMARDAYAATREELGMADAAIAAVRDTIAHWESFLSSEGTGTDWSNGLRAAYRQAVLELKRFV